MDAPKSFWKLCQRFIQDLPDLYPNWEKALDFVVGGLMPDERSELAAYLDKVLARPDAAPILAGLLRKSQADFFFAPDEGVPELFRHIRRRL
jgi:hypothetical protein